jgi:flavin-dependent dehydrogenase
MRPTLTLSDAASGTWDVIVVGAGPAGSIAARQLAGLGNRVLLVDKAHFPRDKVCGCCLNQDSQSSLRSAGLERLTGRLGAVPLHRIQLGARRSRVANLPLQGSVCLSRMALDSGLIGSAIEKGAAFLPAAEARLDPVLGKDRVLHLRCNGQHADVIAPVLLAANGLGSNLMPDSDEAGVKIRADSRIGAGLVLDHDSPQYESGTIYMACGSHGYVGLVRLEDNRLDIAAALDREPIRRRGGIGALIVETLSEAGFPQINGLVAMKWKGTRQLSWQTVRPWSHRTFLVGDAAGYVEPFTGEGIAWALAGGLAVAPVVHRAIRHWEPALGEGWSRHYRRRICQRQWLCRVLANGLRHPILTRCAVSALSRLPVLAGPVMRSLAGH